ncbi:uncharacterized protein LOC108850618 [Raphanus sativus]|uniref:Uncharacterized protein LOC108850618 n=1 Tax=Raphanus sativus TaxID=3726 RepID=A0A6J0N6Q9_RAPSA|nr:uncharacterized protein LOC108850618 [Raphanus sativus]
MRLLSWNCRGLGRSQDSTIPRLKEIRKIYFPEIVFLMETKQSKDKVVDLKVVLGYDRVMVVDPIGLSGGLALMWKREVSVEVKFADKSVRFRGQCFFVTFVYGEPSQQGKKKVWERLMRLGAGRKESWGLLGDFNEILHNGEKIGGPNRGANSFLDFAQMIQVCEMKELTGFGDSFPWAGVRYKKYIQCKLDRCFGNKQWRNVFQNSTQTFMERLGSDHRPVMVNLMSEQDSRRSDFRFDKWMVGKNRVEETIGETWNRARGIGNLSIVDSIGAVRKSLGKWKRDNNLNSNEHMKKLRHELELETSSTAPCWERVGELNVEINKAFKEEEDFWVQKSRDKWLVVGDNNTSFFHASVKACRQQNHLSKLVDDEGTEQSSLPQMGKIATDYFEKLFSSSASNEIMGFFASLEPRVSENMNRKLIREVTDEEVRLAVFSIKPSSAPGSDGMNGLFFQEYWGILGVEIVKEVKAFFNTGVFPMEWNFTQICLIPKITNPTSMVDLRPISLCSVLYKIVAKILVSRIKPLLEHIVSPNQSAFVPERLISDNIIIAHEMIHGLRTHDKISKEFMAIKTDMSKAYDRIEWNYLEGLMIAMGFHAKFREWIMFCVCSVSYTVLINGEEQGKVLPGRGLRQGDPLSPFLFDLCTEGLSHQLNEAERRGEISGIRFSEDGPAIHHLFFADDSLLLLRANEEECGVVCRILKAYELVSGQMISLTKSAITFGSKVEDGMKVKIKEISGITNEGGTGKYLGLPECFSGSKVAMLQYIHEKMTARFQGWYAFFLSTGGKEVLLKSVAMAMPVFAMSVFKLPKTTCKMLTSAMANFWWNAQDGKNKMHWVSWDRMCLDKKDGGMGFKDLEKFNQALLAKQGWRLLMDPNSLCARVIKSRYYPTGDFLDAKIGSRPSYAWRSMLFGRELLVKGLRSNVGSGKSTLVWTDKWLFDKEPLAPMRKQTFFNVNLRVCDLIDTHTRTWDRGKLEEVFFPSDIELIMKMKPAFGKEDSYEWVHNRWGAYSVKSGYWLACSTDKSAVRVEAQSKPSLNDVRSQVWSVNTTPKIKVFMWKALSNALAVSEECIARGMKVDPRCQRCGDDGESINHALFSCPAARLVWATSGFPFPQRGFENSSLFENFSYLLSIGKDPRVPKEFRQVFPWILWMLWKNKNAFAFEGKEYAAEDTVAKCREEATRWTELTGVAKAEEARRNQCKKFDAKWRAPERGRLKCNIGISWCRKTNLAGMGWIVRTSSGDSVLHSRRAFNGVSSLLEAKRLGLIWAVESMISHKLHNVPFDVEDRDLVASVNKPKSCPALRAYGEELKEILNGTSEWEMESVSGKANMVAFKIVQSVTEKKRFQSYVAQGSPSWLRSLLVEEGLRSRE